MREGKERGGSCEAVSKVCLELDVDRRELLAGEKNLRFGAKSAPCRLEPRLEMSLNLLLRPFTPSTQSVSDYTHSQN